MGDVRFLPTAVFPGDNLCLLLEGERNLRFFIVAAISADADTTQRKSPIAVIPCPRVVSHGLAQLRDDAGWLWIAVAQIHALDVSSDMTASQLQCGYGFSRKNLVA